MDIVPGKSGNAEYLERIERTTQPKIGVDVTAPAERLINANVNVSDAYLCSTPDGFSVDANSSLILTGEETTDTPLVSRTNGEQEIRDQGFALRRNIRRGIKDSHVQKVKIDYLSISMKIILGRIYRLFQILLPDVVISEKAFGWNGYPCSASLFYKGMQIGLLAWGATHGRNFASFSGAGCSRVKNWQLFHYVLRMTQGRITRIDLAFDVYNGELTYEDCEAAAFPTDPETAGGDFINPRGGPKKLSFKRYATGGAFGNLGRTLYIGAQQSSKSICIYEKGLEQFGKLPLIWNKEKDNPADAVFHSDQYGCPGGTQVIQWIRLEVRYTSADRILDLGMLIQPDRYFAGAYPFCARVIQRSDGIAPLTLMTSAEISLEKMIHYGKIAYGSVMHVLHNVSHLTKEEVFDRMVSNKISPKLTKAGVLAEQVRVFKNGENPAVRVKSNNTIISPNKICDADPAA